METGHTLSKDQNDDDFLSFDEIHIASLFKEVDYPIFYSPELNCPYLHENSNHFLSDLFNYSVSTLNRINDQIEKIPIWSKYTILLMNFARITVQFVIQNLENQTDDAEPIYSLLIKSTDKYQKNTFNNEHLMKSIMQTKSQEFSIDQENVLKSVKFLASYFNLMPTTVDFIIKYSLQFASLEFNLTKCKSYDVIKRLTGWATQFDKEKVEDIFNIDNLFDEIQKLPQIENTFHFLILKYLYQTMFNFQIPAPFNHSEFYENLLSYMIETPKKFDVISLLPVFAYIKGNPIQLPISLHSYISDFPLFVSSLELSNLLSRKPFRGKLPTPMPESCVILGVQRNNQKVLTKHIIETTRIGIYILSNFNDINQYSLLHASMKGDIESARQLLNYPNCITYLHPDKSYLHKLVYSLLSFDVEFPSSKEISLQMAISLFKARQLNKVVPIQYAMEVLNASYDLLINLTQQITNDQMNVLNLLYSGFAVFESPVFSYKLKSPADFISLFNDNSLESLVLTLMTLLPFIPKNIQQRDESIFDKLADFSLHYCLGPKLHSMITNYFSDTFAKTRNERQIYHILNALNDKNHIEETLGHLSTQIDNVQILESIISHFIRERNADSLLLVIRIFYSTIDQISISLRIDICEQIIRSSQPIDDVLLKFTKDLLSSCDTSSKKSLYKIFGAFSLSNPTNVLKLLNSISLNTENVSIIIESIPQFSGPLHKDFVTILKQLTDKLSYFKYIHRPSHITSYDKGFSSEWEEDHLFKQPIKNQSNDPWEFPRECEPCCSIQQQTANKRNPIFYCNTCGISSLCLNCALSCHSSHDVSFVGYGEFTDHVCHCFKNNARCMSKHITPHSTIHLPTPENNTVQYIPYNPLTPIQPSISASTLVKLILNLSKSSLMDDDKEKSKRFNSSLTEFDLKTMMNHKFVKNNYFFHTIQNAPILADCNNIVSSIISTKDNQAKIAQKLALSPLQIAKVSNDFLIVAEGMKLKSYRKNYDSKQRIQLTETSSLNIHSSILSIQTPPLDSSIIAVASLKKVLIYTLNVENGSFTLMNEIELMLEALGTNIYINSIHWLPLSPLYLAVVCNTFVKVYDVPSDCIAPIACYTPVNKSDSFTSAAFVEYQNECMGFMAISSGQIAIQNMLEEINNGTGVQKLKHFSKVQGIPIQPIISYNKESNLFFINASGAPIKIVRIEDVMQRTPFKPKLFIDLGQIPGDLLYVGSLPTNKAFNILLHPNSGSLVSLEFTDNCLEIGQLNKDYPRQPIVPLFTNRMTNLSTFIDDSNFYTIEKSGKLSILECSVGETDPEIDCPIKVPATFWTNTNLTTSSIQIINLENSKKLHPNDKIELKIGSHPKILEVSSTDSNQIIVGFNIHSKTTNLENIFVRCHGRTQKMNEYTTIPLRKDEAESGSIHQFEIIQFSADKARAIETKTVLIDKIDIFVIERKKLNEIHSNHDYSIQYDWRKQGQSLFDFSDCNERYFNLLYTISFHCALSIIGDDSNLETNMIKELIELIYRDSSLSNISRSCFSRICKERHRYIQIWVDTIHSILESETKNEYDIQQIFCDYERLPIEDRQLIRNDLFQEIQQINEIESFIASFL